jgi:large subunit ribosomal protein L6
MTVVKDVVTKVQVAGERGVLNLNLPSFVTLTIDSSQKESLQKNILSISVDSPKDRKQRAMWGTSRQLINNMIVGVTDGFTIPLKLVGVGYRAILLDGNKLELKLGYTHQIILDIPQSVTVSVPAPQRILLAGNDLYEVTQFAANIRKYRKPEPYNQKGIFVGDETIKKKEGKKR